MVSPRHLNLDVSHVPASLAPAPFGHPPVGRQGVRVGVAVGQQVAVVVVPRLVAALARVVHWAGRAKAADDEDDARHKAAEYHRQADDHGGTDVDPHDGVNVPDGTAALATAHRVPGLVLGPGALVELSHRQVVGLVIVVGAVDGAEGGGPATEAVGSTGHQEQEEGHPTHG